MIVVADLSAGTLELTDPEDCARFHVQVRGDGADLADVLAPAGRMSDAETAWIHIPWVEEQAAGRVHDQWKADFAGMLGYASTRGWLDEASQEIQAHVERA